jgi:hypothetical protein
MAREQCSPGKAARKRVSARGDARLASALPLRRDDARHSKSASPRTRVPQINSCRAPQINSCKDAARVCAIGTRVMRLWHRSATRLKLCDYLPPTLRHALASRFEMRRLPRWMAWKGKKHLEPRRRHKTTSVRACGGRTGDLPVGGL